MYMYMCKYIYIYIRIYIYIYKHIHTYTYTYMPSDPESKSPRVKQAKRILKCTIHIYLNEIKTYDKQ